MSIPQSFIQELLSRVDVVEVVGRYVQLKKGGANFMGLCPFHGEKSPSFSVSPTKQFYHCFGCGANGNAISFLMEHGGMTFIEAVQDLAQQTGLTIPEDGASPQDRERHKAMLAQQQSLTELLEQAAKGYQKHLKTSPRAIAYLKGRGLSGEIARAFGLGYAPEGWRSLASMLPDYADPRLVESGLVIAPDAPATPDSAHSGQPGDPAHSQEHPASGQAKRYDRFRDRIMFPIRNVKGETIGFGGRVLDKGEPKYLNSPETPVFSKGRELYGLFEARTPIRTAGYALVTEGYMDVVALAQLGFANAVATLGTACTADHVQKLFRFTDAVVFSFDGDAAGRRAAGKAMLAALPFAQDTRSIKFLFLPPEHDPDSFIRANGTEAFAQCVQQAVPLSKFMPDSAAAGCDLGTAEGRALMASRAKPMWLALPDGALKRQLLGELAQMIGLGVPELSDLWKLNPGSGSGSPSRHSHPTGHPPPQGDWHDDHGIDDHFEHHGQAFQPEEWHPSPARERPRQSQPWTGKRAWPNSGGRNRQATRPVQNTRHSAGGALSTRPELLARALLTYPQAWSWLTPEDPHLLAKQPEPLGSLFRWLESQWHEHGAQSWAVLKSAMVEQDFASTAHQLMAQAQQLSAIESTQTTEQNQPPADSEDLADVQSEFKEVLLRMHIDDLMGRETQALAEASHNPQALQTYRELYESRVTLQKRLLSPSKL